MMAEARRATILGGPRDGEIVDWMGYELRMPIPRTPIVYLNVPVDRLLEDAFKVDRYVAKMDYDGRWWYVREGRE